MANGLRYYSGVPWWGWLPVGIVLAFGLYVAAIVIAGTWYDMRDNSRGRRWPS